MPRPSGPGDPRPCREPGCTVTIFLARAVTGTSLTGGPWWPFEATDRPPFTQEATGCRVVVSGAAWKPLDLVEHYMTRFETSETRARELVAGYPHHRPHFHHPTTSKEHT